MKKLLILILGVAITSGCGNSGNGQLVGVQGREVWYQPDPFGTLFIPMGSYQIIFSNIIS